MTTTKPTPNTKQQTYIDAVVNGQNTLLTGPGGTGKSFTLDRLREKYRTSLSITASTGIAALNVGGMTINSWGQLGIGQSSAKHIAHNIVDKRGKVYDKMISARRLAIDEISMMSASLLTKLDEVMRIVRRTDAPFGGVQMLFIGDFLQLPPVTEGRSEQMDGPDIFGQVQTEEATFAFESPTWGRSDIEVHELTEIVRQSDLKFATVLNKVRRGVIDEEVMETLQRRVHAEDPDRSIRPVKADSYNKRVDSINMSALLRIQGRILDFKAIDTGIPMFVEQIKKNCIAPEILSLKIGAQVMLLRNLDTENGLVNGALGIVREITSDGVPMVEFAGGKLVKCEYATWSIERDGDVLASRTQIPLKLAWAITIHKSQGQTMDKLEVNLASCFAPGQAYVALSRCRTLEGLFLTGLDFKKITTDRRALNFYGY